MPKSAKAKALENVPPPPPVPLAVPVADSHTHLDMQREMHGTPVEEALAKAADAGVTRVVQIGCDLPRARWAVAAAARHDEIWAAVALHPNEAPRFGSPQALEAALDEIAELAALPQVVALGETGLDYYRTGPEGVEAQQYSFRRHIALAKELDRTLVIHDREAHADVLRILAEEGAPPRTVFHCYSGDAAMARTCAEAGYFMSFAGNVTFASAAPLREALAAAPPELLLVETDAPFLTPVPHRGRPNAPYLIPHTLRAMAEVKGLPEDELARHIADNTARAFGQPAGAVA
ncbi:TatD family hydrolase [Streptomyces sp. 7-21]|uniref:TatD family hydrolase n=1 Tax=Streptomyces sp. 7-21 TaxID=2802283 RepID=UPI00191CD6EC|nr:TatD family hydrolase [Streptomyces sp. 7-21]MBL1068679.1 TatD family hydrolase [Streptomyces sp. 7-21]